MRTTTARVTPSQDEIFHAVEQMGADELEQFSQRVLRVRAGRQRANLSAGEVELIRGINESRPAEFQRRYRALLKKRDTGALTHDEYAELLEFTDRAELYDATRLEKLGQLAAVRGCSLDEVMDQLGLSARRRE
ncbi:MAG TPA: hypothetical protein VKT77_15565 [Chthonomonadaceae bacterium]|nr:hypothetical protein [Chthonomonadaceae bacterium]